MGSQPTISRSFTLVRRFVAGHSYSSVRKRPGHRDHRRQNHSCIEIRPNDGGTSPLAAGRRSTDLEPIEPGAAVDRYLADRELEVRSTTLRSHRSRLRVFVLGFEDEGMTNLNELTGRDHSEYRLWRRDGGELAPASENCRGAASCCRVRGDASRSVPGTDDTECGVKTADFGRLRRAAPLGR